ncbi:MAG: pyruvate, water dikinase [Proteobacteria bacterium]|nr:pyruvate, water dikinase [Pseudomonadota bacterium]
MKIPRWLRYVPFIGNYLGISEEELDLLRKDFQSRYHAFKSLISENQKTLHIITEIEEALRGDLPFDMSYVRSRCSAVIDSVLVIIEMLNSIAPDKYGTLYSRHDEISGIIISLINANPYSKDSPLVLPLKELDRDFSEHSGSKMATLGEMGNKLGIRVPVGFVVTAEAYRQFMGYNKIQPEIDKLIQASDKDNVEQLHDLSEGIRQFVIGCPFPPVLKKAIEDQYSILETESRDSVSMAIRSSAIGEDSPDMSSAGQYLSILGVRKDNIPMAYKEVIASKYQIQAMAYRLNRGIRDEDVAMCVGCMPLIEAGSGGVAYSGNPLNKADKNVIILSVWGHPKPVVDGRTAMDLFVVSRDKPMKLLQKVIQQKRYEYSLSEENGICPETIEKEKGEKPSLSDAMVLKITKLVLEIEKHFGSSQDIEWIVDKDDEIHILQSRPLKQMERPRSLSESIIDESISSSIILKGGITASPGAAAGKVFIVKKEEDALGFPDGAILVASQSLPYWAMLLEKAAAVVTEQGSIAGHLANVAREFGVPAIFGLKKVTERLRKDQVITVDADMKRIYEGRMDALLGRTTKMKHKVKGSATHEALKSAVKHIAPLRLLNPDSQDFRPKNCMTLHDITRFCHEKSVKELFESGVDQRLQKYSSRQLFCEVPMQYWIVDLENGTKKGAEKDQYVHIEDILSIPMLALWRGMNAIRWKGPPPVSAGGFASVLASSTANPSLNPSMPSVFSTRNYFMISKNFCNSHLRFGYHFSTIETLIGENPDENYIRFQFKGGAADIKRRVARANLVAEVLEEKEFRIVINRDSVSARLENYDQKFMESRLEILGYVVIHTRQLDMVMNNLPTIEKYKRKILEQLERLPSSTSE